MPDSERIGPYRVVQRLGAGGMGEVVLAHDDRLDRLVAIKRLHAERAATPHSRERFRREARIAARINHPAIVQIHDVLHEREHDYLIMEYVEGRTLRARRDAGPMTVSEVLAIAHQIALGMAAAHDLGVVHRDLKAENILLTRSGRAKITDFGIAKIPGEDSVTAEGAVIGTFRAMSPEQALGRAVDHRSDLFSFGILLYEALAGESPFHAETPYLTVQRLVHDDPRPIAELVPDISAELASLVHQLLAKEPALRPRHFHEVADALTDLASKVCDAPCHGGSAFGGPARTGEDRRPTDDIPAPGGPATEDLALPPDCGSRAPAPDDPAARDPASRDPVSAESSEAHRAEPARGAPASGAGRSSSRDHSSGAYAHTLLPGAHRRRRWALLAAALGGALSVGYAMHGAGCHALTRAPLVRVAILPPRVQGAEGQPGIALLAVSVRNAIMSDIRTRAGLDLVPRADVDSYVEGAAREAGHPPGQRAIRSGVGADEVIATQLDCVIDSCRVTLERDTGGPGGAAPGSFQLSAASATATGATITLYLSRLYPDHPARDAASVTAIDSRDQAHYLRLVQDYWASRDATDWDALCAELDRIRARSPRSLDVLLFEAEVLRHRYLQTEAPEHARRAMALIEAADRLFPDTYDILAARFDIELAASRTDAARTTLDRLTTLDPDSSTTHLYRAKLARARGPRELARSEIDAAAQRDALSWRVLYHRAILLHDLDERADARAAIGQLLARSPGNYAGLSLLARDDLETGQLACAEQRYAQLVAREPLYVECVNLGYARSQLGRYREAATSFRCALQIRPEDPTARFDLAESLLLAGDADEARTQLGMLLQILARRRHDAPDGVLHEQDLGVEAQTLAYLGKHDAAMAADARARVDALLASSRDRTTLYAAAVVHAVQGDRELAQRYVTEYLDRGHSAADLSLPWFDALRRDPVLGPRFVVPAVAATCDTTAAR